MDGFALESSCSDLVLRELEEPFFGEAKKGRIRLICECHFRAVCVLCLRIALLDFKKRCLSQYINSDPLVMLLDFKKRCLSQYMNSDPLVMLICPVPEVCHDIIMRTD